MAATKNWLSPEEVATYFAVPLGTVYAWNSKGTGPRFAKIGRHVRYSRADVEAWAAAQYQDRPESA